MSEYESVLGIQEKLIARIHPIVLPRVEIFKASYPEIEIHWLPDLDGHNGGSIKLFLASKTWSGDIQGVTLKNRELPKFISSSFDVGYNASSGTINSREALVAVLTMLSTLDRVANLSRRKIVHLVRAGVNSRPYFERFRQAGLYRFSNLYKSDNSQTIYSATYSSRKRLLLLEKFTVEEAARGMANYLNFRETASNIK